MRGFPNVFLYNNRKTMRERNNYINNKRGKYFSENTRIYCNGKSLWRPVTSLNPQFNLIKKTFLDSFFNKIIKKNIKKFWKNSGTKIFEVKVLLLYEGDKRWTYVLVIFPNFGKSPRLLMFFEILGTKIMFSLLLFTFYSYLKNFPTVLFMDSL